MTVISTQARRAFKWVSMGSDLVRRPDDGIVVLIYHRVGAETGGAVDVPRSQFARQLDHLVADCDVVSLGEALSLLADPAAAAPERPRVVITFDDGTDDFVDLAVPMLAERQLPATLYVATDFVEREVPFWGVGRALTWSALNDALTSDLITLGSHTHTHALLDHLPAHAIAEELDRSVALIGERTGQIAEDFAYPKALDPSPAAAAAVAERFRSAALAGTRPNPYGSTDALALRRSPVQRTDTDRFFRAKVRGGMGLEDDIRRKLLERQRQNDQG